MKISRVKEAAIGTIAVMALAGAGAGSVAAVDPTGTTPTAGVEATEPAGVEAPETGVEATETAGVETAEPAGTGVEAGGVGGHADADGVDVDHQFDGNE